MRRSLISCILLSTPLLAGWVGFSGQGPEGITDLKVLESTPAGMRIEISLPGIELAPVTVEGVDYTMLSIPGATMTALEPGYPEFPKISFLAALPPSPDVTITIEEIRTVEVGSCIPHPMQPILPDNALSPPPWTVVPSAYLGGSYPDQPVHVTVDGVLRGVNVGRFIVNPVSWDPGTGLLTVATRMRISIDFGGAVSIDPRLYSRFFEPVFRRAFLNADALGEPSRVIATDLAEPVRARNLREALEVEGADLLILAGDDFVDTMMDAFLDAKHEQGYVTALVAAGGWTYTQIHDYIQNAYETWELPPSFLLFVGDGPQLTAYQQPYGWGDNRYACVDGGDYMADIFHGRFCASTDFYPNIEAKQLAWQFDPLTDPSFWNSLLCAGMLQTYGGDTAQRWFLFTCETVHDTYEDIYGKTAHRVYVTDASVPPPYYYNPGLPSDGSLVPAEITYDGTTQDIIDIINDGVFLIQHRDHGAVSGWADPPFFTWNLASLSNGMKTPVVMSFNCLTGSFQNDLCFAESFQRMQGGAVAVIAACQNSYSYFNDYLVYGCYMSFNDDFVSPPFSYTEPGGGYLAGQMMTAGKLEMQAAAPYNPYTSSGWEEYAEDEWDLFLVFGDPTMDMRTAVPYDPIVGAPYSLPSGSTQATFTVHSPTDGAVQGAMVCMRNEQEGLYLTGLTDAAGSVVFTFPPMTQQSPSHWMVTAHDALPEQGILSGGGTAAPSDALVGASWQPRPNPSSSLFAFPLTLDAAGYLELAIFDIAGRRIALVHSGELAAGDHLLVWDGESSGDRAPAGIYLARLTTSLGSEVHRLVLTR